MIGGEGYLRAWCFEMESGRSRSVGGLTSERAGPLCYRFGKSCLLLLANIVNRHGTLGANVTVNCGRPATDWGQENKLVLE